MSGSDDGGSPDFDTLESPLPGATGLAAVQWGAATSRGRVRATNEDAWGEFSRRFFVVADGMGGSAGGALAATTAVASFSIHTSPQPSNWPRQLDAVNSDVHRELSAADMADGGTTLVALEIGSSEATIAHVGDSRAYRLRAGQENIEPLTVDHNVAEELRAAGESVEIYNRNIGRADALTRYIGGPSPFPPTVTRPSMSAGDRILLCTDGVHGQLSPEGMSEAMRSATCQDAASRLVLLADEAGGRDNATALVVEIGAMTNNQAPAAS